MFLVQVSNVAVGLVQQTDNSPMQGNGRSHTVRSVHNPVDTEPQTIYRTSLFFLDFPLSLIRGS